MRVGAAGEKLLRLFSKAEKGNWTERYEAGNFEFRWFDCVTSKEVRQAEVKVKAGDQSWKNLVASAEN